MTAQGAYAIEPWVLRETYLDLGRLAQSESLFALSNGYVGWRGNLDEGEPHGLPGSYLNGVYEVRPLPYAERLLDFRAGVLNRHVEWVSSAGKRVRVSSTRLVSFAQRSVAAICYEVEPLTLPAQFALQSELVANEKLPGPASADPRAAAVLENPLMGDYRRPGRSRRCQRALGPASRRGGRPLAASPWRRRVIERAPIHPAHHRRECGACAPGAISGTGVPPVP